MIIDKNFTQSDIHNRDHLIIEVEDLDNFHDEDFSMKVGNQNMHTANYIIVYDKINAKVIKNRFDIPIEDIFFKYFKKPNNEQLLTKHMCMKNMLGVHENLFGGILLAWIDEASAIFVSELLETNMVVTVHFGSADFKRPIKEGNIVHLYGTVLKIGNTSITLKIKVKRLDVETNLFEEMMENEITFVQIGKDGLKCPIKDSVKNKITKLYNF